MLRGASSTNPGFGVSLQCWGCWRRGERGRWAPRKSGTGPVTRVRAARRAARSPQAAPTRTATTRRSSCRPEGPAGGTRYRTSSADTPRPASPTYRTVSRNCPQVSIHLIPLYSGKLQWISNDWREDSFSLLVHGMHVFTLHSVYRSVTQSLSPFFHFGKINFIPLYWRYFRLPRNVVLSKGNLALTRSRPRVLQIILPRAGRIRTYRAPRNSTADMPARLRSGSRCRDTLGLSTTDDDDDGDDGSTYRFCERSPRMLFGSRYCDRMYRWLTRKRWIEHAFCHLLGNVRKCLTEVDGVWARKGPMENRRVQCKKS